MDCFNSPLFYNLLGSGTAGIISRLCTHPLDTAKAQMQAGGSNASNNLNSSYDAIIKTYGREGVRGLYRGFGAIVVGGTPGTMIYLCGYDWCKHSLSSVAYGHSGHNDANNKGSSTQTGNFVIHFVSGMLAEIVACVVYVPVDVIKERLQVQSLAIAQNPNNTCTYPNTKTNHLMYKGSWDALVKITKTEGFAGIYRGYGATLASFGPFSALYFVFYEQLKDWAKLYDGEYQSRQSKSAVLEDGDLSFPFLIGCSCGAGALASFLTSPLDMAKLRLQLQRGGKTAANNTGTVVNNTKQFVYYNGMLDCFTKIYGESGVRGLFRGAGARVLHWAPAMTITMTCYEKCRAFYCHALSAA
jgi:hypothetical protein